MADYEGIVMTEREELLLEEIENHIRVSSALAYAVSEVVTPRQDEQIAKIFASLTGKYRRRKIG
jgi:hypothetical protein